MIKSAGKKKHTCTTCKEDRLCGSVVAHALAAGLEEERTWENSLGTKAKNSSVSFSVGQFGKKPRATYHAEQQMNVKGKPSGGANDLT